MKIAFTGTMNFGFVSTRFAGTDGVSLESAKWAEVLERAGHRVFWFSGLSDRPPSRSFLVPEAHFAHPEIETIGASVWNRDRLPPETVRAMTACRSRLLATLHDFRARFGVEVLVPQNAITIPMNLPLGLALSDFLRETGLPAIAHHHDFHWERERFSGEAARAILEEAFPPRLPRLVHAVIHRVAARELETRRGLRATVVPNVMDFARAPSPRPRSREELLELLGLSPGDRIILQPTRVIPRKGIEHAVELVRRLGDPRIRLLVSHEAGDEGYDYRARLEKIARQSGVDLRFPVADGEGRGILLEEWYGLADFVTFPSLHEGFGNALLEAVFFRKPTLINRYPVYREDIEPLGFRFVTMDGMVTDEVVEEVRALLEEPSGFDGAAETNFRLASEHFGYSVLARRLGSMLGELGLQEESVMPGLTGDP